MGRASEAMTAHASDILVTGATVVTEDGEFRIPRLQ